MNLNKKVANFIKLEEGNIGRKAAVVTGALLASTVLGAVLISEVDAAGQMHCNVHDNGWFPFDTGGCCQHRNHHGNYYCYPPCICDTW